MTYKFQGVKGAKDGKLTGKEIKLAKQKTVLSKITVSKENIAKLKKYCGIINECSEEVIIQIGFNKLIRKL
jgi:hypothetical protein|tara:strand:+ start:612 stop:824 length:213 start_codon:yes stop_codon:yes gene_type:complete